MSIKSTTVGGPFDAFAVGSERVATSTRPGLLKRMFDALIEARMREAEIKVARHLAGLSDAHLAALGLSAEEAAEVRSTGRMPVARWQG